MLALEGQLCAGPIGAFSRATKRRTPRPELQHEACAPYLWHAHAHSRRQRLRLTCQQVRNDFEKGRAAERHLSRVRAPLHILSPHGARPVPRWCSFGFPRPSRPGVSSFLCGAPSPHAALSRDAVRLSSPVPADAEPPSPFVTLDAGWASCRVTLVGARALGRASIEHAAASTPCTGISFSRCQAYLAVGNIWHA